MVNGGYALLSMVSDGYQWLYHAYCWLLVVMYGYPWLMVTMHGYQ